MIYLVATAANDPELMPALLFSLRGQISVSETPLKRETWGVGYFSDDRALIVRKPAHSVDTRDVYGIAPDLHSRVVLCCAHTQTEVAPYRFRQWLFGFVGDLSHFGTLSAKLAPKLPDFIQGELNEGDGGQLVHGMFITELHRAGLLDDPQADPNKVGAALKRTVEIVQRLAPEAGIPDICASFVASNGRTMAVSRAGRRLWSKKIEGLERLPDGPVDERLNDFKQVVEALKRFRAYALASGVETNELPSSWTPLSTHGTTVINGALEIYEL